jgi:hypothetical protein
MPAVDDADVADRLCFRVAISAEDAHLVFSLDISLATRNGRLVRLIGAALVGRGARLVEVILVPDAPEVLGVPVGLAGRSVVVTQSAAAMPTRVRCDPLAALRPALEQWLSTASATTDWTGRHGQRWHPQAPGARYTASRASGPARS